MTSILIALLAIVALVAPKLVLAQDLSMAAEGTFSIAARDPATGELGMAVQSKALATGSRAISIKGGVAVIAHQSQANPMYGTLGVDLLTGGMSPQQALDLMMKETYQEREEATAKLRRAKLSSCQLPTYLVGWRDWVRLRELYKQTKGAAFSLAEFHEKALSEGAVPLPVLARLLTGKALGDAR